jgi:hypothetical protein
MGREFVGGSSSRYQIIPSGVPPCVIRATAPVLSVETISEGKTESHRAML